MLLVSVSGKDGLRESSVSFRAVYCGRGWNIVLTAHSVEMNTFDSSVYFQKKHCPSYRIIHNPHCQHFFFGTISPVRAVSAEVYGLYRIIAALFLERQVTDLKKIYIYAMPEKGKKTSVHCARNFRLISQRFRK